MHEPTQSGSDSPEIPAGPTISIVAEMRRSFLDYAMSVIVSRAIPDLRDGLKPVHRRILYAMQDSGYLWNRPYRKSARVVGEVIGRYHPHGDTAVYEALVRMAQHFSMRLPLIDGQGNFGSVDGDAPAAMRYTEVRMARAAQDMLADIDKSTVDFQANYDDQDQEPVVLPARIPNLLVNGAEGIAVGMATRIPPHNLGELVDAALALSRNPELEIDDLAEIVKGPDFPTGGLIIGRSGIRNVHHFGQGSVVVRARSRIEEVRGGRTAILIDELPFQVNKAKLVEQIAQMARSREIEGIAEIRDESDRHGMRVVIGMKRDADPEVVRNQLHRRTPMQNPFPANMVSLIGGRPERFNLKTYLSEFLAFRETVIRRRAAHELAEARDRAHVLCGLAIAVENLDEMVATIRGAPNPQAAREALRAKQWETGKIESYLRLIDDPEQQGAALGTPQEGRITLSEPQIKAILELRLQRLTGLGRNEIAEELRALGARIEELLTLLGSKEHRRKIVEAELEEVRNAHATPRRTEILELEDEVEDEALIKREEMFVTVTHGGYIKRTAGDDYRAQRRGGKGLAGMATKDEDFVTRLLAADTHTRILLFTSGGIVFKMKVWRLPLGKRTGRGKALVNLLPVEGGVTISAMLPVDLPEERWDRLQIVLATSAGKVRRNKLSDFANVHAGGKIAIKLDPGVRLAATVLCTPEDDLLLTSAGGRSIRFPAGEVRLFAGRTSQGVRGMRLAKDDEIVSMVAIPKSAPAEGEEAGGQTLLFVHSEGIGKRVASDAFSTKHRGGRGVIAMGLRQRSGDTVPRVVCSLQTEETDQVMLATDAGQTIRCPVEGVPLRGRTAGGVWMLRTRDGERVIAVTRIPQFGEEEELPESGGMEDEDGGDPEASADPEAGETPETEETSDLEETPETGGDPDP